MIKESAGSDSTEFITVINWFEEIETPRSERTTEKILAVAR